jgi:RNA polymerase sigma-70 factor (ECF subfamily)
MKQLPDNQHAAFVMHKVEGLRHAEIAEVLQVSVSAVESLLHRAKKNLQELLEAYYKKKY